MENILKKNYFKKIYNTSNKIKNNVYNNLF